MKLNSSFDEHIKQRFSNYEAVVPSRVWENIVAHNQKRKPVGFWFNFLKPNLNILLFTFISAAGGVFLFQNISVPNVAENTLITSKQSNTENSPIFNAQNIRNANIQTTTDDNVINEPVPLLNSNNNHVFNNINENNGGIKTDLLSNVYLNVTTQNTTLNIPNAVKNIRTPHLYIPCPEAEEGNAAANKKYIEFYAGPDYAFRSVADNSNAAYLERRKESTTFSSAFSAGVRFTRVFKNATSIKTGINYSQINEKFKYNQGNIVQVTYIINSNGDTTGSFTTVGSRIKTTPNKFRTVDIPLLFGYEFGNGNLLVNINSGIIVNAYSWQKGDVLDTAYQPVNISTGESKTPYQFKTNVGIGFTAGAAFYYKLNDRTRLMAEPYFRYNLSPVSKAELSFKQKYNTAGLRLGLRLDLKPRQQKDN